MVTLFLYGKSNDFFLEGDIRNTPDCPGRNNSHFALENEGWSMSLVFSIHPPYTADMSSRMYVYSPDTICLRNWLTQAWAYASLRDVGFDPVYCIATIIPYPKWCCGNEAHASFIREKITQDAWKVFLHFQVKIRHIIGQTFFTWMYFPTCCCTDRGATCANRKMRPDDLLMHRLYKVGLRLKASESSQCCEGPAVNSAKRKKRPVVPCHLQ